MGWTDPELRAELKRYEEAVVAAGCAPKTIESYVRYATMYLDWRVGDSHTHGADGPNHPKSYSASIQDLTDDVEAYRLDVRQNAGRQPGAVQTYFIGASQFVRWLDGTFKPCANRGHAGTPKRRDRGGRGPDVPWVREGAVQAAVVSWLRDAGWTVERAADTEAREHGPDIVASRGDRRMAIEVKGYPQATYERGERAGEPKRWHPAAQARTYMGNALLAVVIMRDAMPGVEIALALPDVPGYRGLLNQFHASLVELGIRVFLVGASGSVSEYGTATP